MSESEKDDTVHAVDDKTSGAMQNLWQLPADTTDAVNINQPKCLSMCGLSRTVVLHSARAGGCSRAEAGVFT